MSSNLFVGTLAALLAAALGAGWQLASRHGVTTTLGPLEIALLRYGVPAVVLLPVWRRAGWRPRAMTWPHLAVFVAGGLPFGLLVLAGAQFAPAAHIGVFMAGTMPVFTAIAAWLVQREPISWPRAVGFAVILAGVGSLGLSGWQPAGAWRGDLLFLLAAMAWAAHTVAFRRSGLTPWQGSAVVNGWSALAVLLLVPWWGVARLLTAPLHDVLVQLAWQGVLAGLLGLGAYMVAVARLGSARAALSSALVPALTATGAAWLLGEPLGAGTAAAAALVGVGVVLASGACLPRLRTAPARGRGSA
jgi:drug/metabolite transporter (DMT)-like permease